MNILVDVMTGFTAFLQHVKRHIERSMNKLTTSESWMENVEFHSLI
jgi:hypothetical protein